MNRRILMLLNSSYPADIRVKKETGALLASGFEVFLLCLRKKGQPYEETFEGIQIRRIDAGKNNYQLAFWDVMMSINFIHQKFKTHARNLIKKENLSIIHIHDLPLAGTALSIKSEIGIKTILDMHENYPEALKTWFKWKKNPIVRIKNYLFLNPLRWERFEKIACQNVDHIIAVVDEMKNRIIDDYNVPTEKITVVTNSEDKAFIKQVLDPMIYGTLKNKFIITYSGGIGPHRGVDVAIKGMQWLKEFPEIQLAIVGTGSRSVMDNLAHLIKTLGLTSVHFYGYQPFSKFYSYMRFASVNVIPHQSNGHTDNTVPHKLFQGIMAEKPLLVSSSAPLKRLVQKYKTGLVFEAGDDRDFANKVLELYSDPNLCASLGQRGLSLSIHGDVNWDKDQEKLINLYKSI